MIYTPCILLIGVGVVVGSILWLRMHAFLALILASFVVAALTPAAAMNRTFIEHVGHKVVGTVDPQTFLISANQQQVEVGDRLVLVGLDDESQPTASGKYQDLGRVRVIGFQSGTPAGEQCLVQLEPGPKLSQVTHGNHWRAIPGVSLRQARKASTSSIGTRVATGFGEACLQIGLIIAMAGIIGKCLLDSGAADRIVRSALSCFGERSAPVAFALSGFLLAVPVFFDTVFLLMIPLGKAMRMRTGHSYLLYVLATICGGTMAHSLVPPTPGPLAVSEELGVNLGVMILAGMIVGLGTSTFGLLYSYFVTRYNDVPLRESADVSLAELEAIMRRPDNSLPPLWLSLTPILLPVAFIAGKAVLDEMPLGPAWIPAAIWEGSASCFSIFGDKNICISLAAGLSMFMLMRQRQTSLSQLATSVQAALANAGTIILVTAAGGAFGMTLRQTGVASLIETLPSSSPWLLCTLAFLLTTAIRTAQGSATVAMMTAAGILSGLAQGGELGFHPVYLALAIGCGSKPISWMNDSGFIVMTRMSGMTEAEGLKFITPMTSAMGLCGLILTLIGVSLWPNF